MRRRHQGADRHERRLPGIGHSWAGSVGAASAMVCKLVKSAQQRAYLGHCKALVAHPSLFRPLDEHSPAVVELGYRSNRAAWGTATSPRSIRP